MVEKLSELGVAEFVPLAAARSVVLPEGKAKRERWNRIATEAAKQSRRAGVMRISELTDVATALRRAPKAWFLSTESSDAAPVARAAAELPGDAPLTAFIGPEGGWTDAEREQFVATGATPVRLTTTILRIETAAVATAAVVASLAPDRMRSRDA
jgi:16S rRNA (uracil1498-N3)-methyltransferase